MFNILVLRERYDPYSCAEDLSIVGYDAVLIDSYRIFGGAYCLCLQCLSGPKRLNWI
jgi:hypothetical protein